MKASWKRWVLTVAAGVPLALHFVCAILLALSAILDREALFVYGAQMLVVTIERAPYLCIASLVLVLVSWRSREPTAALLAVVSLVACAFGLWMKILPTLAS